MPQELTLGAFDKVINTLHFSRGLFGKKRDPEYVERLLRDLTLWNKRHSEILARYKENNRYPPCLNKAENRGLDVSESSIYPALIYSTYWISC